MPDQRPQPCVSPKPASRLAQSYSSHFQAGCHPNQTAVVSLKPSSNSGGSIWHSPQPICGSNPERSVFLQNVCTLTSCLPNRSLRTSLGISTMWGHVLASWIPGTGHVLHNSRFQTSGGDVELNNRHSSWD